MESKLEQLKQEAEVIWNLKDAKRMLGWDQQVMMPSSGAPARARHMATIQRVAHERLTADSFHELLKAAEDQVSGLEHEHDDACLVRCLRRHYDRSVCLPASLVQELTETCALSFEAWVKAKADDDYESFKPHFKKVLELKKQVAEQQGYPEHPYDAFLDDFEPGMKASEVRTLFEGFRVPLVDLVRRIRESNAVPANGPLEQEFPIELQSKVCNELAVAIGYRLQDGRIDAGPHPFCSASATGDVRLINRFGLRNLPTSVFGTLHEAGHGIYEQCSPPKFDRGPLRGGCSLGVHESQSRMWENFVGRSRPFWKHHFPRMRDLFPTQLTGYSAEDFYRAVNRVRSTFIRVEADEVTYTLHVIMRFEIEMDLVEGKLNVDDVPEVWNAKMQEYLGITPPNDRLGCLQDIHWSDGLIGYFPTYSIGNMIAAQMWDRIEVEIPGLDAQFERGDCTQLLAWLQENVYDHGRKFLPAELVQIATGKKLGFESFQRYLEKKYTEIYQL